MWLRRVIYRYMDDTLLCPICGKKMRTINLPDRFLNAVNKRADYTERTCTEGMNHRGLRFFADKATNQVDLLTLSLNPKNTKYLEIDFVNQKCRIRCMKDGKPEYINIDKMIQPDFPELTKLKDRVLMYVLFS